MQPDDDSQTTLSKWPFIIGDVLLVATALAIAILGHWQLTDWQVGACVAAVALGAALFVLPYIVEYQVRVREEREDRASDLRILEKHLLAAEQAINAADARIRALESTASEAEDPTAALAEATDQKIAEPEQKNPEPVKPEQTASPEPEKKAAPIERPQREARERRGPQESRLLKRAISGNGDKSSTAVSRIIESKAKGKVPEGPKESEEIEPESEKEESAKKEEPEKEEFAAESTEESTEEAPAPADSDLLFDEDKITSRITRTKAKKNDAVLIASVFIGIGNKPYLRGSGAGLCWEKGQLMEFQEIGKWRWVAPSDLEAPVELQIYRNDEDPDQSGTCSLAPGQKLEITPVF